MPKRKDGIIRSAYSLSAPSEFDQTPIFLSDNTSRDFFPVTPDEVREELDQFPQDDTQSITHIWFCKHSDEDIQAYVAVGRGAVAVVMYPMRKNLIIDLGNRRLSGRKFSRQLCV